MSSVHSNQSILHRLHIYRRERFSLVEHFTLILLFVFGNIGSDWHALNSLLVPGICFLILFSFFFRLRIYDDIKDQESDVLHHPERTLSRKVVSAYELKITALLLLLLENILVYFLFPKSYCPYLLVSVYSILMFNEFFVGHWLRRHLTLYAVCHTFCIGLLVVALLCIVNPSYSMTLPHQLFSLAFANWAIFNFYEFARKTNAPTEEVLTIESYSSKFGIGGAILLSMTQIVIVFTLLSWTTRISQIVAASAILLFITAALFYLIRTSEKAARLYRSSSLLTIGLLYISIGLEGLLQ